ncbi:MAG: PD-(D/E)XK nuclease family protein [Patescibacteria group bacterium]
MTRAQKKKYPIEHWSYSSLMSFLRNPLAWHKRYVEKVYDLPSTPSSIVGRAGHKALEHYYSVVSEDRKSYHFYDRTNVQSKVSEKPYHLVKESSIEFGLHYLRTISDFEIDFGKAESERAKRAKRKAMEEEYLQAIGFYLARAPRHRVLGVEVMATARVKGLPLPVKAISDLVVESKGNPGYVDIVDHKFVDSFSALGADKPLFVLQALFNYYTVLQEFKLPVKRFIVQECKKKKNRNGGSQMKRSVIEYEQYAEDFEVFRRLIRDASAEIARPRKYLPNPSDMFEGKNTFEIYRLEL